MGPDASSPQLSILSGSPTTATWRRSRCSVSQIFIIGNGICVLWGDIAPGDRVIFANNVCDQMPSFFCWDDSRQDIIARGGEKDVDYI